LIAGGRAREIFVQRSARRWKANTMRSIGATGHLMASSIDGIVDVFKKACTDLRNAGFNQTAAELIAWGVATGDHRLTAGASALIELALSGDNAWQRIGELVRDPDNNLIRRFRLAYANVLKDAGQSQLRAAEWAAGFVGAGP
jgi:hypothetical protein